FDAEEFYTLRRSCCAQVLVAKLDRNVALSPDATRLTERPRTSPAANTPGMLVFQKRFALDPQSAGRMARAEQLTLGVHLDGATIGRALRRKRTERWRTISSRLPSTRSRVTGDFTKVLMKYLF